MTLPRPRKALGPMPRCRRPRRKLSYLCDATRPYFAKPFEVDGWVVVTDGHLLLGVPKAEFSGELNDNPDSGIVRGSRTYLMNRDNLHECRTTIEELAAWAGSLVVDTAPCTACTGGRVKCFECSGTGKVDGTRKPGTKVKCSDCRGKCTRRCETCHGKQKVYPVRVGRIGPVMIDRRLLATGLACIPTRGDAPAAVFWNGELDHIRVEVGGSILIVMPRRPMPDEVERAKQHALWPEVKP